MKLLIASLLAALFLSTPVMAQDRLIESMIPEAIAKVMRDEGYTAEVKKRDDGKIYIDAKRDEWTFTVEFFSCDLVKGCEGLEFYTWYKRSPGDTLERVNEWNATKRFLKVSIDKDGDLETTMDVSLLGKMTYANFADTLDWWLSMSGDIADFFPEKAADVKAAVPAKPSAP